MIGLQMDRIKLIAEIGWNHMGDMELAQSMMQAAAEAGADYVKFQTWKVKHLKPGPWDHDGRKEIYLRAELSDDDHRLLKAAAVENNVEFLTSLFCIHDFDLVHDLCEDVKIPSTEAAQIVMVQKCIDQFRYVFISTGAMPISEYARWASYDNVYLLHCVSAYPCEPSCVNLPKFDFVKSLTDNVGYSGHMPNPYDAMAAIARGAKVVEKHFTIDHDLPGRDNKFALLPEEFAQIKQFADMYEQMCIDKGLDVQECESGYRQFHKGRWAAE